MIDLEMILLLFASFAAALFILNINEFINWLQNIKTEIMNKASYLLIFLIVLTAVIMNLIFFVGFSLGNNSTSISAWHSDARVAYGILFSVANIVALIVLVVTIIEKAKKDE